MNREESSLCTGQDEASAPAPVQSSNSPHLEDTTRPSTSTSAGQNAIPPAPILQPSNQDYLEDHLEDSPPPPTSPPPTNKTWIPLLHTMSWLILFSILGTLTRLGLSALTVYPGTPIGGVIWAQFAGCMVMGFLVEDLRVFSLRPPRNSQKNSTPPKSTLPLYLGLTTGYCGSVTSFSSFLLVTFELLSNTVPAYHRAKGYGVLAALGYVIGTLSLSFSGLQFGAQVALFGQSVLPSIPERAAGVLDWGVVPVAVGVWVGAVVMAVFVPEWREEAVMACVFAPLGTLVRFWMGRWLNARVRTFPIGTFLVNVGGTAVLAGLTVGRYGVGGTGCAVVRGWGDGFCGCLTTISTFVVEVRGLRLKHAYVYAGTSIIVGFCLMVLVLGSYTWSHDVNTLKC